MTFAAALRDACRALECELTPAQAERLETHYRLVVDANRRFNLTRITDPVEAAIKHYADSLAAIPWARQHAPRIRRVLDVGTGAGFPAVPLAVVRPDWHVTAIDGTGKKARFVADCAATLGLSNLRALHAHSTDRRALAETFDLVTCRAVAKLPECIQQTAHLIAPAGSLLCYKSARIAAEERIAARAAARDSILGPATEWPYQIPRPAGPLRRLLIRYRRCPKTPSESDT